MSVAERHGPDIRGRAGFDSQGFDQKEKFLKNTRYEKVV